MPGIKPLSTSNRSPTAGAATHGAISVYSTVKRGLLVFLLIPFVPAKFETIKDLGESYVESKTQQKTRRNKAKACYMY